MTDESGEGLALFSQVRAPEPVSSGVTVVLTGLEVASTRVGFQASKGDEVASKASDVNTRAADVVAQATGQTPKRKKDPAAVARGRLGGQARARNTPPMVRSSDAREAVNARWAAERSKARIASP